MSRPKPEPLSAADAAARALAQEANSLDLALAAAGDSGAVTLTQFLAHELAAGHRIMMRLAAKADAALDRAPDDEAARAGLEAARLAGAAARLMERFRLGLLALAKLRAAGEGGAKKQVVVLRWGNEPEGGAAPATAAAPVSAATAAAPAAANRGRLRNGNPSGDYTNAPRCGARARHGTACRQPAMRNGRCRMHGGLSTGARTPEGKARAASASLVHGFRSAESLALDREAARTARRLAALIAAAPRLAWGASRNFATTRWNLAGLGPEETTALFSPPMLHRRRSTG